MISIELEAKTFFFRNNNNNHFRLFQEFFEICMENHDLPATKSKNFLMKDLNHAKQN